MPTPQTEVSIVSGPLPELYSRLVAEGAGAVLLFEGIVRPLEGDSVITGLHYEAYRPMAERQLEQLAHEMLQAHGLLAIQVEHSEGLVPAGACSFRLQVASAHRAEAIRAVEQFIDLMKQRVPIWKTAVPAAAEVR